MSSAAAADFYSTAGTDVSSEGTLIRPLSMQGSLSFELFLPLNHLDVNTLPAAAWILSELQDWEDINAVKLTASHFMKVKSKAKTRPSPYGNLISYKYICTFKKN